MPTMGRYCKAYPMPRLREYAGWPPDLPAPADVPEEDHYYFLQDNYTVTKDIFLEDVVFDQVSDEWRRFCRETLEFDVPPEIADPPGEAADPVASTASDTHSTTGA